MMLTNIDKCGSEIRFMETYSKIVYLCRIKWPFDCHLRKMYTKESKIQCYAMFNIGYNFVCTLVDETRQAVRQTAHEISSQN